MRLAFEGIGRVTEDVGIKELFVNGYESVESKILLSSHQPSSPHRPNERSAFRESEFRR